MPDELTRWINRLKERRRNREEIKDVLSEYFESGINRDEEVAQALNLKEEEIKKYRRDYEE